MEEINILEELEQMCKYNFEGVVIRSRTKYFCNLENRDLTTKIIPKVKIVNRVMYN